MVAKRNHPEADLSQALAEWLAYTHAHDNPKGLFSFMVPNERSGNRKQQAIAAGAMLRMGLRPGVADWVFVWLDTDAVDASKGGRGVPADWIEFDAIGIGFIELKAGSNKQSDNQRTFQAEAEAFGLRYAVCRSLDECIETLTEWGAI